MKSSSKLKVAQRRMAREPSPRWTAELVGLPPSLYQAAVHYVFDRPVPDVRGDEWFWQSDEPEFEASPLEWTRIQTVLFAQAADDLACYSNEQVGMGLDYIASNSLSDVPFAAVDPSVPVADAVRMIEAMPALWCDGIAPRLTRPNAPIGADEDGRLGSVCYMWFDVWPTYRLSPQTEPWREAMLDAFARMLESPCRAVQVAALHGIGHSVERTPCPQVHDLIDRFLRVTNAEDEELRNYAEAARHGGVQ